MEIPCAAVKLVFGSQASLRHDNQCFDKSGAGLAVEEEASKYKYANNVRRVPRKSLAICDVEAETRLRT